MINLLQKCQPSTIHNFSFVNNEHFKLIKLLKTPEKIPIIVTGVTGIGKTAFVKLVAKFLNFEILEIDLIDLKTTTIKNIIQACTASFDNKERVIVIENFDFYNNEKIDNLFERKLRVVFITSNIYMSKLSNYRKDCSIVNLQMKDSDVVKVVNNIIEKQNIISNTNNIRQLIDKHGCDIRAIINDLEIFQFQKNNEVKLVYHKSVFKAAHQIFSQNIRAITKLKYYEYLSNVYDTFGDRIIDTCYENYCKISNKGICILKIADSFSSNLSLPHEYRFSMLDLINNYCRKSKGIEISMHKNCKMDTRRIKKTCFFKNIHHFDFLGNQEYLLKDVYQLYCIKMLSDNDKSLDIYKFEDSYPFLKQERTFDINRKKKSDNPKIKKLQQNNQNRKFVYKYNAGVSANARIDVKFADLFK